LSSGFYYVWNEYNGGPELETGDNHVETSTEMYIVEPITPERASQMNFRPFVEIDRKRR